MRLGGRNRPEGSALASIGLHHRCILSYFMQCKSAFRPPDLRPEPNSTTPYPIMALPEAHKVFARF